MPASVGPSSWSTARPLGLVTLNALVAVDAILVLPSRSWRSKASVRFNTVARIGKNLNPKLHILGALLANVADLSQQVEADARAFGDLVFGTIAQRPHRRGAVMARRC